MSPTPVIRPDIVSRPRFRAGTGPDVSTRPKPLETASVRKPKDHRSASSADRPAGYANPPQHTRFKPGQSGNPKGRPKGARSTKVIVREMMNQKVVVRSGGRVSKMRRIDALMHKIVEDAFAGKPRDRQTLLSLYEADVAEREMRRPAGADQAPAVLVDLDEHDDAVLATMREMMTEELRRS